MSRVRTKTKKATKPRARLSADQSRELIRGVARDLYVRNGYAGFSFADIVAVTGTTRANVHHHFGGKHRLMAELVAQFAADAEARILSHWARPGESFTMRLRRQLADLRAFYDRYNTKRGERNVWSPLARLRLDLPVLGPLAAQALERVDKVYEKALTQAVREAVAAGEFAPATPVADVARLVRFVVQACPPTTQDTGGFESVEATFRALERAIAAAWRR